MSSTRWQGVLERLRRAQTAKGRARGGEFVIEGPRLLRRALDATVDIAAVAYDPSDVSGLPIAVSALLESSRAVAAPPGALLGYADGRRSGRVVALARLPAPFATARDMVVRQTDVRAALGTVLETKRPLLVAVDVEEPGNVGALVRTAHASGAAFLSVGVTDPYHPKAVRTSLGSVFRAPPLRVQDTSELLEVLRALRVTAYAAVSHGGRSPWNADFGASHCAILVGSEAQGLPLALAEACTGLTIPMPDDVDSYSVNAAASILLYEVSRPRGAANAP